jgi:hypothetical protein
MQSGQLLTPTQPDRNPDDDVQQVVFGAQQQPSHSILSTFELTALACFPLAILLHSSDRLVGLVPLYFFIQGRKC